MQKQLRLGKRTLALILAAVMALGLIPVIAAAADYAGHWAEEYIESAIANGWMIGDDEGNFNPDSSITRSQFAVMLWRALGEKEPQGANPFSDVGFDTWYAAATMALYEAGVVSGVGNNLFDPNGALTREMGVTMLARAFDIEPEDPYAYAGFDDGGNVAEWAAAAVSALCERGYVSGVGENLFAPQTALRRGEMAKLLTVICEGESLTPDSGGDGAITITLSHSPTISTSGNVTITATVASESGSITYVGSRISNAGATYTDKTGFNTITTTAKFTVSSNGWYAVCAEDSTGAFAYKLIQITNITGSSGSGSIGGGGSDGDGDGEPYTVKFVDSENPATVYSTQTVEDGTVAVRPSDPVKNGFEFAGWYADAACATPWVFTMAISSDVTIYAKWTPVSEPEVGYTVMATADPGIVSLGKALVTVKINEPGDNYYIVKYNGADMIKAGAGLYQLEVDALGGESTSGLAFSPEHELNVFVELVEVSYTVEATTQFVSGFNKASVMVTITVEGDYDYSVKYNGAPMNKIADKVYLLETDKLGDEGVDGYTVSALHAANVDVKIVQE